MALAAGCLWTRFLMASVHLKCRFYKGFALDFKPVDGTMRSHQTPSCLLGFLEDDIGDRRAGDARPRASVQVHHRSELPEVLDQSLVAGPGRDVLDKHFSLVQQRLAVRSIDRIFPHPHPDVFTVDAMTLLFEHLVDGLGFIEQQVCVGEVIRLFEQNEPHNSAEPREHFF
jgi:hypothetical protein